MQKIFCNVFCKTLIAMFLMLPFFGFGQDKNIIEPDTQIPQPKDHISEPYIPKDYALPPRPRDHVSQPQIPKYHPISPHPKPMIIMPSPMTIPSGPRIEGLASFRLNRTTTKYIDTLATLLNRSVVVCSEQSDMQQYKSTKIIQLKADSLTTYLPYGAFSPNVDVYYIDDYKFMNTYDLRDIYLTFYKGLLTQLYVVTSDPRLDSVFILKYGKPQTIPMQTLRTCYKKEKKFEFKDSTNLFVWSDFENDLTIHSGNTYDISNCEPKKINYLTVKNISTSFKAMELNQEAEKLRRPN